MEHDEQAEEMEHDAERMEHESERVGDHIDEARREWEAKEQDPSVPGAQPEESDQLPEEAPADQVPDDAGAARDEAEPSPGVPGEEGTATGNRDAAGAEEPGDE